jgi:hypothetical protein
LALHLCPTPVAIAFSITLSSYQESKVPKDLTTWVVLFRSFVGKNLKVFAYANNHYAGHSPATVEQFWKIWNKK